MLLWIILSQEDYDLLLRDGVYRITEADEELKYWGPAYDWLNGEMEKRVGPAPEGTVMPVCGWLRWEAEKPRPDLRWVRWNWYPCGQHVLLQADVPEEQVVCMDAGCWTSVLNGWLITDSEEESDRLKDAFERLPEAEQKKMLLHENWRRAFDIEYAGEDDWRDKGNEVEAVFWELRKEQIRSVKAFTSKMRKDAMK